MNWLRASMRRIQNLPSRTHYPVDELNTRDAYRLWANSYANETAISFLDETLAQTMLSGLPRQHLLDAGCGIGRRIQNIANAVGIDLSPEMLAAGPALHLISGDIRDMPFESNRFDMVWCRLVLGHIPDPLRAYSELSRVCRTGGFVFVTDFHPDAVAAGHRRTMNDRSGAVHSIEHYVHSSHVETAASVGLQLVAREDGSVGPSVLPFYRSGIGMKAYRRDMGLKLVSAFLFQKTASVERQENIGLRRYDDNPMTSG